MTNTSLLDIHRVHEPSDFLLRHTLRIPTDSHRTKGIYLQGHQFLHYSNK
jgi:hypothetical protein